MTSIKEIKEFIVNLDESPEKRWSHIVNEYKPELTNLAQQTKKIIAQEFGQIFVKMWSISHSFAKLLSIPSEYKNELLGIAEITKNYQLDFDTLLLFNVAIDYMSRCTSIVTMSKIGQLHLRNLDWDIPLLSSLLVIVNFQKNNTTIYKGITFVGHIGILTGLRCNEYSVSINFRKPLNPVSLKKKLSFFPKHYYGSMILRNCLEKKENFSVATEYLETTELNGSFYFIICGKKVNQGEIIARHKTEGYVEKMTSIYLVQTNHDNNVTVINEKWAENDNILLSSITRKKVAQDFLETNKNNFNLETAKEILSSFPVKNSQTIFSCIMIPATSKIIFF